MKILFVSMVAFENNTSATIQNKGIVQGLSAIGHDVDIMTLRPNQSTINYDESMNDIKKVIKNCYYIDIDAKYARLMAKKQKPNEIYTTMKMHLLKCVFKKGRSFIKNIYDNISIFDAQKVNVKGVSKVIINYNNYDIIISASDPKSSHLIVERIFKENKDCKAKWLQYWGDPMLNDITRKRDWRNSLVKWNEKRLIKKAHKIIYASPLTLNMQKKTFPQISFKMDYANQVYANVHNINENIAKDKRVIVGYCGAYHFAIRNIMPLYNAAKDGDFELKICGTSDIILNNTENISVQGMLSYKQAVQIEEESNILVCICNNRGTQIPGKIYYCTFYKKPIVIILDGEYKKELKEYFNSFNRFILCENKEEDIKYAIQIAKEQLHSKNYQISEQLTPQYMAKKIIGNLKIGLFGIYGLYNYGCEAIVRGTYELIRQAWPNCEIILYTYFPQEDRQIINDLNIIVKPIPLNKGLLIRRVINKFLRFVSVENQFPMWDAKSVADECDMVFSIGGDIYTIPKNVLDKNNETKYSALVEFGKIILKYKPFIIWGASIGPFGEKIKVKQYYFDHLRIVNQIFCREKKTLNYLKNNNVVSNVQLCSDPAFYINNTDKDKKEYLKLSKLRIALNLSPLSIREQMGQNNTLFKEQIINTIKDLLKIPDAEIVLVPHVLSPLSENDNDLIYLQDIYNSIPKEYIHSVSLLKDEKGFLGTKEYLKSCDIVIAARMHCAINAICEGIPTIFLTYSQKGLGMANYIYGNSKWAISLINIENELKNRTLDMLANKELISKQIKQRIKEIRNEQSRIINLFKKLI